MKILSAGRKEASALGAAALALLPGAAEACAVCLGPPSGGEPGLGLDASLLFMLAMPFVVVASVGGWLLWAHRRARNGRVPSSPESLRPSHGEVSR